MSSSTPSARRPSSADSDELAAGRAHRRDAPDRPVCLSGLRPVADAREPRAREAGKWIERAEDLWGAWGTIYREPPSDDAVLVTCAYLLSDSQPWVEQSLFLAAIGEARDKGARALEAFAYRYPEGTPAVERFLVHRTVFPRALPRRLRLPHRALGGPDRAGATRPRRPAAGRGGCAPQGAPRGPGGVPAGTRARPAGSVTATLPDRQAPGIIDVCFVDASRRLRSRATRSRISFV